MKASWEWNQIEWHLLRLKGSDNGMTAPGTVGSIVQQLQITDKVSLHI